MTGSRRVKIVAAVGLAISLGGCGGQEVEVTPPRRAEIVESFTEPAETRHRRTRTVHAPLDGRIGRIDLEPGDPVEEGQALVEFDATPYGLAVEEAEAAVEQFKAQLRVHDSDAIENSLLASAEAIVEAARDTVAAAQAETEAERARFEYAAKQLERTKQTVGVGAVTETDLDDAQLLHDTARIALGRQQFMEKALEAFLAATELGPATIRQYLDRKQLERNVIERQLANAEARLSIARHDMGLAEVVAPAGGVVLRRFTRGEGVFSAGTPLVEIGAPEHLEAKAEVLTGDALLLEPGGEVELDPGRGLNALRGRIERIEPAAFTKRSALGVEQQRVNVVIEFVDPPERLGVGYRVHARFVLARTEDALVAPRFSVLEAPDGERYVFKVVDGRLVRQGVKVGLEGELEVEIVDGVTEEDMIARTPDVDMEDGARVRPVSR